MRFLRITPVPPIGMPAQEILFNVDQAIYLEPCCSTTHPGAAYTVYTSDGGGVILLDEENAKRLMEAAAAKEPEAPFPYVRMKEHTEYFHSGEVMREGKVRTVHMKGIVRIVFYRQKRRYVKTTHFCHMASRHCNFWMEEATAQKTVDAIAAADPRFVRVKTTCTHLFMEDYAEGEELLLGTHTIVYIRPVPQQKKLRDATHECILAWENDELYLGQEDMQKIFDLIGETI